MAKESKCKWRYNARSDIWETACKREWIIVKESLPVEEMNYCVFCGKPIDVEKVKEIQ